MVSRLVKLCDRCDAEGHAVSAVTTMPLVSEGHTYELDVCQAHVEELEQLVETLRSWASCAHSDKPSSTRRRRPPRTKAGNSAEENDAIRAWARQTNRAIGDRGRISDALRADFRAAFPHWQPPSTAPQASSPGVAETAAVEGGADVVDPPGPPAEPADSVPRPDASTASPDRHDWAGGERHEEYSGV